MWQAAAWDDGGVWAAAFGRRLGGVAAGCEGVVGAVAHLGWYWVAFRRVGWIELILTRERREEVWKVERRCGGREGGEAKR